MKTYSCVREHNILLNETYHLYLPNEFNCKENKVLEADLHGLRFKYVPKMESRYKYNFQEPMFEHEVIALESLAGPSTRVDGLKEHIVLSGKLNYSRKRDAFLEHQAKKKIFKSFRKVDLMQLNQLFGQLSKKKPKDFVRFTNTDEKKDVYFQLAGNEQVLLELSRIFQSVEWAGRVYFWFENINEFMIFNENQARSGGAVVKGVFNLQEQIERVKKENYWRFLSKALCRGGIRNFYC